MLKHGWKFALVAGGAFVLVPMAVHGQYGLQTLDRLAMGTPQQIERGEQVFDDQCAECHGDEGVAPTEMGERMGAEGFVDTDVERSGPYSIFHVVTHGYEYNDEQHPAFENLRYQDRWAVAHYTNSLIADPQPDPDEIVAQVRREAQEGICDPDVREEVADFAEPEDDEQIQRGQDQFGQHCAACHGEDGRGITPDARDFHDDPDDWVHGTSPFGIFQTLDEGIPDTAMASFAHLPDEDLWAMVHFMRDELIPSDNLEEVTEEEIDAVCRALSAPEAPDPIAVDRAVQFLIDDADDERYRRLRGFGDPIVMEDANIDRGGELFQQSCASCHGADGSPETAIGPYGKFPPYLHIETGTMHPASAGGSYEDFAQRVVESVHASLPDRPTVATYSAQDWMDLQAWLITSTAEEDRIGYDRIRTVGDLQEAQQYLEADPALVDEDELDEDVDEDVDEEADDEEAEDQEDEEIEDQEDVDDEPQQQVDEQEVEDQQEMDDDED